jgi:hypothetical protein
MITKRSINMKYVTNRKKKRKRSERATENVRENKDRQTEMGVGGGGLQISKKMCKFGPIPFSGRT